MLTRRCNLSCGYCFEYDKVSKPVPLDLLKERIDHLAKLRSVFVTLARHAKFHVRINTVRGSSAPEEVLEVARAVLEFGFDSSCSLVRDETGALLLPVPEPPAVGKRSPALVVVS